MYRKQVLKHRLELLSDPKIGIITPADSDILKFYPFEHAEYKYKHRVGRLSEEPWSTLCGKQPVSLLNPDPFALSNRGLACWDTAVAIPACVLRSGHVTTINQLTPSRNVNTYWLTAMTEAMRHIGPRATGEILRPVAPFLADLTKMDQGYMLLEAAHILAHERGDEDSIIGYKAFDATTTLYHFKQAIAELIVGLLYDIPIYVDKLSANQARGKPTMPAGIVVNTTDDFKSPILYVDCAGNDSLAFDEATVIIHVALYTEPHPYGYVDGTNRVKTDDYWCCHPTMINIIGWECVDYITHQQIVELNRKTYYGIHHNDLLPPDMLIPLLPEMPRGTGWYKVEQWMTSSDFNMKYWRTPPLPCKNCLMHNRKTELRPVKPDGKAPKRLEKKHTAWRHYTAAIRAIFTIIQQASMWREASILSGEMRQARKIWRIRIQGYKQKLLDIKQSRKLFKVLDKVKKNKALTKTEVPILIAYRNE